MNKFNIDDLYESIVKDYSFTYAKITAIGKKNICFEYSKDLDDLNKGICVEGSASFEDFLSHYERYIENPKKITLYRYLVISDEQQYCLTEWDSEKLKLNDEYIKEFTKEIEL